MLLLEQPTDIYTRTAKDLAQLLGITASGVRKALLENGTLRGVRVSFQRNRGDRGHIRISEGSYRAIVLQVSRKAL